MPGKRPFVPRFLSDIDRKLLLNHPEVWSARTHLVLYFGLIIIVILALLALVMPDDPRTSSRSGSWVGFVSVISLIAFIAWIIFLLRFNVFKRFGRSGPLARLKTFLLYFISTGIIVLFPYVAPVVESARANNAYTDAEVYNDIDTLNLFISQLEYDSIDHRWTTDTLILKGGPAVSDVQTRSYEAEGYPGSVSRVDHRTLENRLRLADSSRQVEDSVFVLYSCPNYTPLDPYFSYTAGKKQTLSKVDVFHQVIRNYHPPSKDSLRSTISRVAGKYAIPGQAYYRYYNEYEYYERLRSRYDLWEVSNSMENIMERKHRFDSNNMPFFIRMHVYTSFILSLLLFVFRHSTVKTFFLSLLTAVVLTILTTLFIAFTFYSNDGFFNWILFYFFLFFAGSFLVFVKGKRSVFAGISINLFTMLLPFIPLCLVASYYEQKMYRDYELYYDKMQQSLKVAEWIGIILFLIALVSYIHVLYRNWYASPEE